MEVSAQVLETVNLEFEIKAKLPTLRSKMYSMRAVKGGYLQFNPADDDNAKQGTLDELPETKQE